MTLPPPDQPPVLPGAGPSPWQGTPPPSFVPPTPMAAPPGTAQAQFELAGWGARAGALIIDQLIRLAIATMIAVGGFVAFAERPFSLDTDAWVDAGADSALGGTGIPDTALADNNLIWLLVASIGIYAVLAVIYAPLFMAMWRGATPGKAMLGIRVVREDGSDLGFGMSFVREPLVKGVLVSLIGATFFLPWVVNYLWPLWDRECRAGHDFLVRTRVVKRG